MGHEDAEGNWLVGEETSVLEPGQPLSQWAYHISAVDDSTIRLDEYSLTDPSRFAGAWREAELSETLSQGDTVKKDGCSVILRKSGDATFAGGTIGTSCVSSEHDADYTAVEVRVDSTGYYRSERFFDANEEEIASTSDEFRKQADLDELEAIQVLAEEFAAMEERARLVKSIQTIRLVWKKSSDVSRTEYQYDGAFLTGTKTTPVFDYSPDRDVKRNLDLAGFSVIPERSSDSADATLNVTYRERTRGGGLGGPKTHYFSFELNHQTAGILAAGGAGPSGSESASELRNHPHFQHLGNAIRNSLIEFVGARSATEEPLEPGPS
jgi:hypothetical protein